MMSCRGRKQKKNAVMVPQKKLSWCRWGVGYGQYKTMIRHFTVNRRYLHCLLKYPFLLALHVYFSHGLCTLCQFREPFYWHPHTTVLGNTASLCHLLLRTAMLENRKKSHLTVHYMPKCRFLAFPYTVPPPVFTISWLLLTKTPQRFWTLFSYSLLKGVLCSLVFKTLLL